MNRGALWIVLLLSISSRADFDVIEFDEETASRILPAHFVNTIGFSLPKDHLFNEKFSDDASIVPMYPLYKSKFAGKQFLGVSVPGKHAGLEEDRTDGRSFTINTLDRFKNDSHKKVATALQAIEIEKGVWLVPHRYNGKVYGIRSDYRVQYGNSTSIGISIGFGGDGKTVNLGESQQWGIHANLGVSPVYLGGVKGFNLASDLSDLFDGIHLTIEGDKTEKLIEQTLRFTPAIQLAIADNFKKTQGIRFDQIWPAQYAAKIQQPQPKPLTTLPLQPQTHDYSAEYKQERKDLLSKLKKEEEWKSKVEWPVKFSLVFDDFDAQSLLQAACDHLASAYQMPPSIWPRCRIAATPVPNAWAYPGGDIFVAAGLIGVLSDLESLMFILSHEIGHVFSRHTTKMIPRYDSYAFTANAVGIANSVYRLSGGMGTLGSVSFLNWFYKSIAAQKVAELPTYVIGFSAGAFLMAHSRDNESQADRIGHELALLAGIGPDAIKQGWEDFQAYFKTYLPKKDEGFFKKLLQSHPDAKERLRKIQERNQTLAPRLAQFSKNAVPAALKVDYFRLHKNFESLTALYGEYLRDTLTKKGFGALSGSDLHFYQNFFSLGSQCTHSLYTWGASL